MKVRTTKRLASLLGVGMIALAILAYVFLVLPNGELGQIGGFALLQGIEAKYRNNPEVFDPIVLKNPSESNFVVLGLPSKDKRFPLTWIILNQLRTWHHLNEQPPESAFYIVPADQKFNVSCSYLNDLSSMVKINEKVLGFLKKNCTP